MSNIRERGFGDDDERLNYYLNNTPDKQQYNNAEKQLVNLEKLTGFNYKQLRILCKHDIFFLSNAILGYSDLSPNLHGHLAAWMMRTRLDRFRMLLLPRGHYKTTIWTISDSIRIALPDDGNVGIWPECLGPNCRILIGHEIRDSAANFLVSIAGHFLSNPLLMLLFPECVPTKKQRINKYEIELPRESLWNEPTFGTIGVGGRSQGIHYNYIKLDDIIGDKARDSKKEMQAAKDWIDNIQSFFVSFGEDHLDIAGTRWAPRDVYYYAERKYGKKMLQYRRPAEEIKDASKPYDAETNPLVPIFPEKFSTEDFEIIKKNPIVWAAQYANNPEVVGREFDAQWKRYYKWLKYPDKLCGLKSSDIIDLTEVHQVQHMHSCILIDPAMTGNSGIIVTLGAGNKQFIVEAIKHPLRPPEFVELLFLLVLKWKPQVVAVEEVLFSGLYQPWLIREMQARRIYFNIQMYKVGNVAKEARVRGLASYFKNGAIYFSEQHKDLIEEYDGFGSSGDMDDMHLLDALSAGPRIWTTRPFTPLELEKYRAHEEEFLKEQDEVTGY